MNGQELLNRTLKFNAGFSLLSGIDFLLFDRSIAQLISGKYIGSLAPMGAMLIGFAVFVFVVSTLKNVNRYLVGSIIIMDVIWVIGSFILLIVGYSTFTLVGILAIALVALVIATFAYFQTRGLRLHLNSQSV